MRRRRLLSPPHRPLVVPGTTRRLIRPPDVRHLVTPRLSAAPLTDDEIDFDDLIIHRTWRSYEPDAPNQVRYFMFEYSQHKPGEAGFVTRFKAVRFVRLTRVPRYLRSGGGGHSPHMVFSQQRDVLTALRERNVLFVQLIAKSRDTALIFAYGVQGVGATPEEAQQRADDGYAVLTFQLNGTYQQLEYAPLTLDEGEKLARYQAEWNHIAMARGRPMQSGAPQGASAIFDGNRSDIEGSNNQLESFIRGMTDAAGGFMMSLVSVPLPPGEMSVAWRNISQKLSDVRSDTHGQRGFSAGVALPLGIGNSLGDSHGNTHSAGVSEAQALAEGQTATHTEGISQSQAHSETASAGESHSVNHGQSASITDGQSESVSMSRSEGLSQSLSDSLSHSLAHGQSISESESLSHNVGASHTEGQSVSQSLGETHGLSQGESMSRGLSATEGQSLAHGQSAGQNWSNSLGQSVGSSLTETQGWNRSAAESLGQSISLSNAQGDSQSTGQSQTTGSNVSGGLLGFGGGGSTQQGNTLGQGLNNTNTVGLSQTGTGTHTVGVSDSMARGLNETLSRGESMGGSLGESMTATNSVGRSESLSAGQSLTASHAQSTTLGQSLQASDASSVSLGRGSTLGHGQSLAETSGIGRSVGVGSTESNSAGSSAGLSRSATEGVTSGEAAGQTRSVSQGATQTAGTSQSAAQAQSQTMSQTQALNDAYAVAMSRTASTTGSLGVVPSFGYNVSKATLDAAKVIVGDILEEQMRRYLDGIESGAFLYQLFLVTEDRETLIGAAGLLKSAFWGAGDNQRRVAQPFHVITEFGDGEAGDAEKRRLLTHASMFTSYLKREPVMDLIEPYVYSSYVTPGEMATFSHPPTAEAIGLHAVADSAPVLALPSDRHNRDLTIGHLFNGERARVSEQRFGIDVEELTHTLITGVTGSGKTTTLMRLLAELARVERTIIDPPTTANPYPVTRTVHASILGLDWMRNMRHLGSILDPVVTDPETGEQTGRFQFFSIAKPELGEFRWNLLEVPARTMQPQEWLNAQADNMVAAMSLGEFGRSLIAEFLEQLYSANRLVPFVLRPERRDDDGNLLRPALHLPPIDRDTLPAGAIQINDDNQEYANVYTCTALSRLIDITHLATLVASKVEELATPEGARLYGTSMRDRLQSVWRRVSYYASGGQFASMLACDPSLDVRETLAVADLVNPERGLVTILETDGLDIANRRLILGSVLMAVYRYGLHHGEGVFDQNGKGPGLYCVLEEAHELFGEQGEDEDGYSASTRTALFEGMHRRARALGLRLIDVVQNPGSVPEAITSNTSTVFVHRTYADADRQRVFSLLNWTNAMTQHQREYRWLGEQPRGYVIARLDARNNFLESVPVQLVTEPATLGKVDDDQLEAMAVKRDLWD